MVTGPNGLRAVGFAPAHITGAFLPRIEARDPRGRGSVGIGLVLDAGVRAEAHWVPAARSRLSVVADRRGPFDISREVATRLLTCRPGNLSVRLRHELPIGQGFGTSASGALATALAVGTIVGSDRARSIEVAHLADLFGGGGLGGVAAILGGGLERRVRPGLPPRGRILRRGFPHRVFVAVVGPPMKSPRVLSDERTLGRIAAAYAQVDDLIDPLSPAAFWNASERFTDRVGVAPREVRDLVRAVRRRGGRAAQAMFGRSVVATVPDGRRRREWLKFLGRRGIRAVELGSSRRGACVVSGTTAE
jgi:pantoate kinase